MTFVFLCLKRYIRFIHCMLLPPNPRQVCLPGGVDKIKICFSLSWSENNWHIKMDIFCGLSTRVGFSIRQALAIYTCHTSFDDGYVQGKIRIHTHIMKKKMIFPDERLATRNPWDKLSSQINSQPNRRHFLIWNQPIGPCGLGLGSLTGIGCPSSQANVFLNLCQIMSFPLEMPAIESAALCVAIMWSQYPMAVPLVWFLAVCLKRGPFVHHSWGRFQSGRPQTLVTQQGSR